MRECLEFHDQLGDDSGSNASLLREVEDVGVCNNGVISLLPALFVSNAAFKTAAIIVVDGVAIYLGE